MAPTPITMVSYCRIAPPMYTSSKDKTFKTPNSGGFVRMAYIAQDPESHQGTVVGSGQCVAFVEQASGAPLTSSWHCGDKVRGNSTIQKGTAIATFDANGKYTNSTDGTSHAAIYIGQDAVGLQVWDQWTGQP